MSIKNYGGVFGRNPKFNSIEADSITVAGEAIPDLTTVLVDGDIGSTVQGYDAGLASIAGLTTSADQMVYLTGSDTYAVTSITSAGRDLLDDADASAQRTTLGLGTAATSDTGDFATAAQGSTADSALQPGDIGSTVQGYDADTAKYDDATANFTGTLQNGGSDVLVNTDIGSTVQGYDADTAKLDVAQTFTASQTFESDVLGKQIMTGSGGSGSPYTITITGMLGIGSGTTRSLERLNLVMVRSNATGHVVRGYALYTSQYNGNAVLIATLGTSGVGGNVSFGTSGANPTATVTNTTGNTASYTVNAVPLI